MKRAADHLVGWFKALGSQVNEIADEEDRRRLLVSLANLHKDLYDAEWNTDYLMLVLQRHDVTPEEVQRTVSDTRRALTVVYETLRGTGLSLRQELWAGGADAESEIRQVLGRRALWLSGLERAIIAGTPIDGVTIEEGRLVLDALREASIALVEVMERLRR
jgi:hypothetical protein